MNNYELMINQRFYSSVLVRRTFVVNQSFTRRNTTYNGSGRRRTDVRRTTKNIRVYSHQKRAFFFCCGNSAADYQNPMHLNGARWRTTFFRRRTSRCLQNLVRQRVPSKCMGFCYIRSRISAAEQTRVFGVNRPQ